MYEIAANLHRFLDGAPSFYLKLTPETPDFTANKDFTLSLFLPQRRMDIVISPDNILDACAAIQQFVFQKDKLVLCWNIKELFTYSKFYTKTLIPCESTLIDLKLIESFLGIEKKEPESYMAALDRAKAANKTPSWKKLYNKLFLPLTKEVVPSIETIPLLNEETKKLVYSHYQIDGQANGRSLCSAIYQSSYNPHNMGDSVKSILRPSGYGNVFLYFDFSQMEVSVLQWLSADPVLKTMLESGKDFYKMLHLLLFSESCKSKEDRAKCKEIFLPVVYGQSANSLANKFDITIVEAENIIKKLRKVFSVAFTWLENAVGEDYFGRKRNFEDAPYKARNFCVQSPASVFCLEKLVELWIALREKANVVFHIHDGYGIICKKDEYKDISAIAREILESYSGLMPGLSIKVVGNIGIKLNRLFPIEIFERYKNVPSESK